MQGLRIDAANGERNTVIEVLDHQRTAAAAI